MGVSRLGDTWDWESMSEHEKVGTDYLDDDIIAARARALSSPVRWRILRTCLEQSLTNKELADLLGVNPGSMLHHVRTLVATGFLEAGEIRRGARNSIEIPYRTTDLVWAAGRSAAGFGEFLLGEVEAADVLGEAKVWRNLIRVDAAAAQELQERLDELFFEYHSRGKSLPEEATSNLSVIVSLRPQES